MKIEHETCRLLFVYGTLRLGTGHAMAAYLSARASFIGLAKVRGQLFDFGIFPGLVEAQDDGDWIAGEVWQLTDVDATLHELDRYEGCVPHEPQPWVFERRLDEVVMENGRRAPAWVYWYCGDRNDGKRIVTGDYLRRQAKDG